MNIRCFVLLIVTSTFVGCNSMRRIHLINQTGKEAEVIWKLKEDSINSSPLFLSNDLFVRFPLSSTGAGSKIKLSVGRGSWSKPDLVNFVDDLEWLEIKWNDKSMMLKSEEEINKYLEMRRRGADKSRIYIILK